MLCPICGVEIPPNAEECPNCGAVLPTEKPAKKALLQEVVAEIAANVLLQAGVALAKKKNYAGALVIFRQVMKSLPPDNVLAKDAQEKITRIERQIEKKSKEEKLHHERALIVSVLAKRFWALRQEAHLVDRQDSPQLPVQVVSIPAESKSAPATILSPISEVQNHSLEPQEIESAKPEPMRAASVEIQHPPAISPKSETFDENHGQTVRVSYRSAYRMKWVPAYLISALLAYFFSMSVDFYGIANPTAIFFFTLMIYWTISASRLFLFFFIWTGAFLLIPPFRDSLFNSNDFIAFFLEAIVLNFTFYFGLRGSFIQKFVFLVLASCAVWTIHNILNYSLLFDLLDNVPLLVMILVASYLLILVRQGSFFYKIFRFICE